MIVPSTIVIPADPAPWTTEFFQRSTAVDLPAGYKRCKHISNGFRCSEIYTGGPSSHAFCFAHRNDPGEYVKPPTLMEIVAATVDELGRASLRHIEKAIPTATGPQLRGAASRAAEKGLIGRGRRPGFYVSKRARV